MFKLKAIEKSNDGLQITWAHAVNSTEKLVKTLESIKLFSLRQSNPNLIRLAKPIF
jgi:hypothetical protein